MHPRLIETSFLTIPTFGVLLATAYMSALAWLAHGARRARLDVTQVVDLGVWAIVGALVGAKALLLLREFSDYTTDLSGLWALLTSAGDFYGGFIGGLVAAAIFFVRHSQLACWQLADLCAPSIALGQAIGRIGCLMAGDDYGSPTNVPWAVTFTDPDAARIGGAPLGVPLHPVQLYESLFCLALFALLVWLSRRPHRDGDIIVTYTATYAVGRFLLEYLRGDVDRGFVFGGLFSTSQFIAILLLIAVAVVLPGRQRRPHRQQLA
jgi:phosphatidylglycerol:prolipoprotein diacylglycerol transferase